MPPKQQTSLGRKTWAESNTVGTQEDCASTWLQFLGFPSGASGKEPAYQSRRCQRRGFNLGQEDPLEGGMATHSSILGWRIPLTEEPARLRSIVSHRVGHP